jgi:hypothetical protein
LQAAPMKNIGAVFAMRLTRLSKKPLFESLKKFSHNRLKNRQNIVHNTKNKYLPTKLGWKKTKERLNFEA